MDAKLALDLFQMTAHGLLAETQQLGDLLGPPPRRNQPQDGEFAGVTQVVVSSDRSARKPPGGVARQRRKTAVKPPFWHLKSQRRAQAAR